MFISHCLAGYLALSFQDASGSGSWYSAALAVVKSKYTVEKYLLTDLDNNNTSLFMELTKS